ncbi:hypothetical protein D3C79_812500 [compost metagenome]
MPNSVKLLLSGCAMRSMAWLSVARIRLPVPVALFTLSAKSLLNTGSALAISADCSLKVSRRLPDSMIPIPRTVSWSMPLKVTPRKRARSLSVFSLSYLLLRSPSTAAGSR